MSKHDLNTKKWLYSFKVPRTYTNPLKRKRQMKKVRK